MIKQYPIYILLSFTTFLLSCGGDDDDNNDVEPVAEFEIEFPTDWEVQDSVPVPLIVAGFSPPDGDTDTFRESINVGKEEAPGLDLDTYAIAGKESLIVFQDFEKVSEQSIEINSRAAEELIYSFNLNGVMVQNIVHIYYANDIGYVVTASATKESFDSFSPAFDSILGTFVIN